MNVAFEASFARDLHIRDKQLLQRVQEIKPSKPPPL